MIQFEVKLQINNLKDYQVYLSKPTFYLVVWHHQTPYVSYCRDILHNEGIYSFQTTDYVQKIQIWNYDSRKRVGTLKISDHLEINQFQYEFKNFNLKVSLQAGFSQKQQSEDVNVFLKLLSAYSTRENSRYEQENQWSFQNYL